MIFDYDTTLFTKCDTVAMGVLAFLQIDSWKPLLTHFCPYTSALQRELLPKLDYYVLSKQMEKRIIRFVSEQFLENLLHFLSKQLLWIFFLLAKL